jgi:hypothetical protein
VGFNALLRRVGSGTAVLAEVASPGGIERLVATPIGEPTMDGPTRLLGLVVAKAIAEATQRAAITLARIDEVGLQVVTTADPAYPRRLASIDMPPHVLFVLGEPAVLEARSPVAVVGTRRATDPGRAFAARLAASLVSVGSTVVSGLATGIDAPPTRRPSTPGAPRSRSSGPVTPPSFRVSTGASPGRSLRRVGRSRPSSHRTSVPREAPSRAETG